MKKKIFEKNFLLFKENDFVIQMYFILKGKIEISSSNLSDEVKFIKK